MAMTATGSELTAPHRLLGVAAEPTSRPRQDDLQPRPGDLLPGPLACASIALAAAVLVGVGASFGPVVGLGALLAVALGLATLLRPMVGALVIVGVAPITSGMARGFPIPGFRISELAIGGLGVLVLLTRQRRRPAPWGAFEWSVVLYCAATAILGGLDLVQRGEGFSLGSLGSLFGPLQLLLLYLVAASVFVDDRARRLALRVMLFASVPVAILAIMQEFDVAGVRQLLVVMTGADYFEVESELSGAGGVTRATGPFNHWHQLSGYLAIIVLLCVVLLLDRRTDVLRKRWLFGLLGLATVALIQTATITTIGIALIGTLVLAHRYRQLGRVLAQLLPLTAVASLLFLPLILSRYANQFAVTTGSDRSGLLPATLAFRWETWTQQWIPVLHGRWLSGYGPNLPTGLGWKWPDSLYLELILRGGVPLLLAQLALMLAWGFRTAPLTSGTGDPLREALTRVIMVLIVWLAVAHTIVPYFVDAGVPYLLFLLAGLSLNGAARHTGDRRASRPRTGAA
jgi:hypothetical protein